MKKIAFLDRDGALIFEPKTDYQIDSLEKLKILDGVIDGLKKLQADGYKLVMVSNQDGVGTKSFPQVDFDVAHNKLLEIFSENNIEFDEIFICPHMPEENCSCRKPKIGLVEKFIKTEKIDLKNSIMIGDRDTDEQFAENIGVKFIKMKTNSSFPDL